MNRRVAGWLAAVTAIGLILSGVLVWLWVQVGGWPFPVILAITALGTAAYVVRMTGLVRRQQTTIESVALTALAPLLPRREALVWLPEMDGQLLEARGDPVRWRAMRSAAVRSMPALLRTAWGASTREGIMAIAVRYARPRVVAIDHRMRSPQSPWPTDRHAKEQMLRRLRTLSICSRLLVFSAGKRQQSELIGHSRRLIELSASARQEFKRTAHHPQPSARMAALVLEIQHLTMMLAAGLIQHRRWNE